MISIVQCFVMNLIDCEKEIMKNVNLEVIHISAILEDMLKEVDQLIDFINTLEDEILDHINLPKSY